MYERLTRAYSTAAHAPELLLDSPAQLDREGEVLFDLGLRALAVRVQELDQTRGRARDRLPVALLHVAPEVEVAVVDVGVVARPELVVEDLGDVVGDEAHVGGEVSGLHLRQLPAGQVRVPAIVERHVVADRVRERQEQVRDARDGLDVAVEVAVEDEPRLALDACPSRCRARTSPAPCSPCTAACPPAS